MKSIDHVHLTAYALGEGTPAERAEIAARLRTDPAAQAAVDDVRALAARLESALAAEPDVGLTADQRAAVFAAARPAGRRLRFPWRRLTGFAAVAAIVTLVFGGALWHAAKLLLPNQFARSNEISIGVGLVEVDDQQLDEIFESKPREELPDLVGVIAPPEVAPLPEIQDFCAAPKPDTVTELNVASDSISPIIMKGLAPGALANRSGAGRAARSSSYGGRWLGYVDSPPADNAESYAPIQGNTLKSVADEPLSTFSIDVDTASYANVRRFLRAGEMPPPDAVRVEEMINYFPYGYAPPKGRTPFAVHVESAACPWAPAHPLVRIALKGKALDAGSRPPCNLVFLIDVSGSMTPDNKLPLVKKSIRLLARQLAAQDRISLAVYASAAGLVLPATPASDLAAIDAAVDNLQAGGSTAGGAGIQLAYDEARRTFLRDGNNRIVLCTDGDFNVGITDSEELAEFIAARAKQGIFLTVLGFGMGNLKDDRLEKLADQGNGNYAYVDSFSEARKVLAEQVAGTLFAIAKDVKLQIEFNPAQVAAYRLVGYENRLLAKEDFNDDRKDAGELGADHAVTAFYELVPAGAESAPGIDPLKYQPQAAKPTAAARKRADANPEWLTVKLRYKQPKAEKSAKIEVPFAGTGHAFEDASADFRFAAGVAAAGLMLRGDPAVMDLDFSAVAAWAAAAVGTDPGGYRREFIGLLRDAAALVP
ncbi:MAG: von Willebrand factor type A domain-containing protein [Kiritimatiellia bacterium]